ncbi:alpha-galactosidase [Marinitoga arctica]
MNILGNYFDGEYIEFKKNDYLLKLKIDKIPEGYIIRGKVKGILNKMELFDDIVEENLFINNWQSWSPTKKINISTYKYNIPDDWKSKAKFAVHPIPELLENNIISDYFLGKENKLYGFLTSKIAHPFFIVKDNKIIACLEYFGKKADDYIDIEPLIILENEPLEKLLEIYADYVRIELNPKFSKWNPIGWSSWYQYFENLTWEEILKNLKLSMEYNYEVFQLDDSWQKDIGDWKPKELFPSIETISNKIKEYGYIPGLWLAPFSVSETSEIFSNHKDWLVKDKNGNPKVAYYNWNKNIYALDTTHPESQKYLSSIFNDLRNKGIHYFKIDFLFAGAIPGKRHLDVTPIEAYNIGMNIIRKSTNMYFVLGCGAPILPSVGYVDGMRISTDTAPFYKMDSPDFIYPNAYYALRNVLTRSFMNGKWWWNDPDCLLLRTEDTELKNEIIEMYSYVSGVLNNMIIQSDDLEKNIRKDVFSKTLELKDGISHVKGLLGNNDTFEIESYNTKSGNIKMKIDLKNKKYEILHDQDYIKLNKKTVLNEDGRLFHYYEERD